MIWDKGFSHSKKNIYLYLKRAQSRRPKNDNKKDNRWAERENWVCTLKLESHLDFFSTSILNREDSGWVSRSKEQSP